MVARKSRNGFLRLTRGSAASVVCTDRGNRLRKQDLLANVMMPTCNAVWLLKHLGPRIMFAVTLRRSKETPITLSW